MPTKYAKHDASYYGKCMIGGALACGITHIGVLPLDIVKCNIQANPTLYSNLAQGFQSLWRSGGLSAFGRGWLPTAIGYHLQGSGKFGFNEFFKDRFTLLMGDTYSRKYRRYLWAAAAACAEFVADIALCPFEMVKVRVQTDITCPQQFVSAWRFMSANRAATRFPFGSIIPVWSRQVPYTVAKFVVFEQCVEWSYHHIFTQPRQAYSRSQQLSITFACGYVAGIVCAVVSQPADNLVSQFAKDEFRGKGAMEIARFVGIRDLFLKGLGTRIVMVGTLSSLQWWIYDSWKVYMGLGTSGGKHGNMVSHVSRTP